MLFLVSSCSAVLTSALPRDLHAQSAPLRFRRLSAADGLSQQTVNAIAQDRRGFLWFGTEDGLNRFDGYSFSVFRSTTDKSSGLRNNIITRLLCTKDGRIWSGTIDGGVSVYDPEKELYNSYRNSPGVPSTLRTNNAAALFQDSRDRLWVGVWNGGLSRLDTAAGASHFTHYLHNPRDQSSLSDDRVSSVLEDRQGNLWVGTWNGLNRMDRDGRFTRFVHSNADPRSLGGNMVWSLTLDSTGCIWVGTWDGGVSRFDPASNTFHVYQNLPSRSNSLSSNRIRCAYTDLRGIVWIGTYDTGLDRYDPASDGFVHHRNNPADPSSLPDDEVQSLFQDASGTFWVGTASGVATTNPYRHKFSLLTLPEDVPRSSFNQLRSVCIDRGTALWCGTRGGGLMKVIPASNTFIRYRHSSRDQQSLSHDFVSVLHELRSGALLVGTQGGGLNRMDRATGRFTRFMHDPNISASISSNSVASIVEASDGTVWIGTEGGGLDRMHPTSGTFTHLRNIAGDTTSLSGNYVWALIEDKNRNVWVGTWGAGLSVLDPKTQRFVRYRHVDGDSSSLASGTVLCMARDRRDRMWIGTTDGVSMFDDTANRFITYGDRHGLGGRAVMGIAVDRRNAVWVATNRGVSRFDEASRSFRTYTLSDGLQGTEFAKGVGAVDARGRIYFGGDGGLNMFDPDSLKDNPFPPPVQITGIKVMEQPYSLAAASGRGIVLNDDQNFISFEYAALSFAAPERNMYSYKLEGVDAEWVEAGPRRYASYSRLAPGSYVFRVRGSNNDGVWNLEGASLAFTIVPPFWMTWWFRAFVIFAFLSVGPVVYFRRVRQLKTDTRRQEDFSRLLINSQEDERKRIASELHDSIGQNLLYIKNTAVLGMNKKDPNRFTDISETASSSIEEVRRITYDLFPYQLDRMGLTKAIESVVRKTGESSGIDCRSDIRNIDGLLGSEQESSVFRIVQECLNNIVKHSGASAASVVITNTGHELRIAVGDNGRGFNADHLQVQSKGFGLKNIRNRVSLLGGTLTYTSSEEFTTLVSITLRLSHE